MINQNAFTFNDKYKSFGSTLDSDRISTVERFFKNATSDQGRKVRVEEFFYSKKGRWRFDGEEYAEMKKKTVGFPRCWNKIVLVIYSYLYN